MAGSGPRINSSELFRCMLALCLDENNVYRRVYQKITQEDKDKLIKLLAQKGFVKPKRKVQESSLIFGIAHNTLYETVVLQAKAGNNRSTLTSLVEAIDRFRTAFLTLFPESELQYLEPVSRDDFDPEVIRHVSNREDHLYKFGAKLGYCKRTEDGAHLLLKSGRVQFDRMAIIKAVDRKKNTANKPGCGVNLSPEVTKALIDRYEGVYALYYPAGYPGVELQGYFSATMRISHTLEEDNKQSSVIRAKLNIPNVTHAAARYQYRGYLTPIGNDDHLHLSFYLATSTINREECLPEAPPLDPDVANIICSKMVGRDQVFRGILSSLSQRDPGCSRLPYATKVLIKKQEFKGTADEIHDAEVAFMQREGLGYFETLGKLVESIKGKKEASVVERYFGEKGDGQALIYSDPIM